jgi:WD repeat and FYVE domain-containing protein 3
MRYEPANAKFFETEVRWKSLGAALKLLGCFDANKTHFEPRENSDFVKRGFDVFEKFFCNMNESFGEIDREITAGHEIDAKLVYICYILRYLYDTAIDSFDKYAVFESFFIHFLDGSKSHVLLSIHLIYSFSSKFALLFIIYVFF